MPSVKLTQKFIDTVQYSTTSSKTNYFDTETRGLGLELREKGLTFFITYRNDRKVKKQHAIGNARIIKLADARQLATQYLSKIALGENPFEVQKLKKDIPTFAEFIAESYMPHIKGYKRSWDTDESLLRNHILPVIGKLYMDEINRRHMVSVFATHRESHKPGSTNRIIILCRYIFNCAIKWQIEGINTNPTAGIELYPENNKLERYLTPDEAKRLFDALDQSQAKMLKPIITMLLLTGARRNEVLQAKWSDFDFAKRLWRIEKNKSGKTRYVPLNDGAVALLQSLERFEGCEYAFPNPETLKPYTHIFQSWNTVRKKAGLSDFRIHDLRHSFASFLVNNGRSLYEVQKILGHTQIKTTQRYAHLANDTLIDASNTAFKALPLQKSIPALAVPLVKAG